MSAEDVAVLSRRGVALRRERVSRLGPRPGGRAVISAGSHPVEIAGLLFDNACRERSALASSLGWRFTPECLVETKSTAGFVLCRHVAAIGDRFDLSAGGGVSTFT